MMGTSVLTIGFAMAGACLLMLAWMAAAAEAGGGRRLALAGTICFGLAAWGAADIARAQDGRHGVGHAELHADVYRHWKRPDMPWAHCCNDQDCRPTRAFLGDDGRWRAWDGRGWLPIPPSKLLPTDMAGDGRNHLCAAPDGRVYCFSPTSPKF